MDVVTTTTDSQRAFVKSVSATLAGYRGALIERFPERERLIDQLLLCLLTGNNLIVFGTTGTGKSLLIKTLLGNIVGKGTKGEEKQVFLIQLDSETTADALIGPPNLALLEQGILQPSVDGYLPTAHFAWIEELFDAPAVLRSLLDIFNEHQLQAGRFVHESPLMTAIGTTNRTPDELLRMFPHLQLEAVLDRFLCTARVAALEDPENVQTIIGNHLMNVNETPLGTQIRFEDLQTLVALIGSTNQFPSTQFTRVYADLVRTLSAEFKRAFGNPITDRRKAWMTQAIEASAIIHGRAELFFDDMYAIGHCLAPDSNGPEEELFRSVAIPLIEAAKKAYDERVDDAVVLQLDQIEADLKALEAQIDSRSWPANATQAGEALAELRRLENALSGVKPTLITNELRRRALVADVQKARATAVGKS